MPDRGHGTPVPRPEQRETFCDLDRRPGRCDSSHLLSPAVDRVGVPGRWRTTETYGPGPLRDSYLLLRTGTERPQVSGDFCPPSLPQHPDLSRTPRPPGLRHEFRVSRTSSRTEQDSESVPGVPSTPSSTPPVLAPPKRTVPQTTKNPKEPFRPQRIHQTPDPVWRGSTNSGDDVEQTGEREEGRGPPLWEWREHSYDGVQKARQQDTDPLTGSPAVGINRECR